MIPSPGNSYTRIKSRANTFRARRYSKRYRILVDIFLFLIIVPIKIKYTIFIFRG